MFLGKGNKIDHILEYVVFILYLSLMLYYDYQLATIICEKSKIPFDLTMTCTSAGFGNNIIILFIFIEIVGFVYFFEIILPNIIHILVWKNYKYLY